MTVRELIEALSQMNPDSQVAYEVDGEVGRTGDYCTVDEVSVIRLRRLSDGGCDSDVERESEYWRGEAFNAVLLR